MVSFPREFYLVTGLATLASMTESLISPIFSLYLNERVTSPMELGLIISLMPYTTLATQIPLGMVTRRVGFWWVVPLALIGQSSCHLLYSLATNPAHFYAIRVFHAAAFASLHPTLMSLASAVSPEGKRGEGLGLFLTSVGLSMMGGPLLCGLLLSRFDYRTILMLSSVIPLIIFPVYIGLLRTEALGRHLSKNTRNEGLYENPWRILKGIVTLRPVQALTYVRFTFAFTMAITTTVYAVYAVNNLQIDPSVYALFITLEGLANTLSRTPTGRFSDLIGRKKPLLTSFIMLTAVFLLFSEAKDPVTIGLTMFLYGTAHGIRAVSEWSLLVDVVPRGDRGLANFYFSSVFDLGSALGATFAGSTAMMMSTPMILKVGAIVVSSSVLVVSLINVPRRANPQKSEN